jgi:hypothetical protein
MIPNKPCPDCGSYEWVAVPADPPHAAATRCKKCDKHRSWLTKTEAPPASVLQANERQRAERKHQQQYPLFGLDV